MSFLNLSLKEIQQSLIVKDVNEINGLLWLLESYKKTESFWSTLLTIRDSLLNRKSKSIPYKYYNFYDDILIENERSNTNVLEYYDEFGEYKTLSYSKAKLLTDIVAQRLEEAGLSPGQKLAILYPFGISFLISILAGLKIGAILCPILNRRLSQETIELINPDIIISDISYKSRLVKWKEKLIVLDPSSLEQDKLSEPTRSYSYKSGELAFLLPNISLTSLIKISADEAYLYPLRDALITYALAPSDKLVSIGFDVLKSLILLLSSMLIGASYNFITKKILNNYAQKIFHNLHIKTLGVSDSIVELLLSIDNIDLSKRCEIFFRDPGESISIERYQRVIDKLGLKSTLITNVRLEPNILGSSLSSIRFKGKAHQYVFPSPGAKWTLVSPVDSECKSILPYGCITIPMLGNDKEQKELEDIISKYNHLLWLYASPYVPIPKKIKKRFPVSHFMAILKRFKDESINKRFEYCLLLIPSTEKIKVVLLIFTGDIEHFSEINWKEGFIDKILKELGREFLPDKIEFFKFYPRYKSNGSIDNKWCYDQYISGMLYKKSNKEVYRVISLLRKLILNN